VFLIVWVLLADEARALPFTMFIKSLRIENFRNLGLVQIAAHEEVNFIFGDNGAGKTSVLEAMVVLSRGRSFKTAHAEELTGAETGAFRIFSETGHSGRTHKLGLERDGRLWKARKDGQDVGLLSVLTRLVPLVLMEPNSHLIVSGAPDVRRRYLDWGVFHVEPAFLETWRRYSRALKQRNAALRLKQIKVLDSLDEVTAGLGEALHVLRAAYFERLKSIFHQRSREATSLQEAASPGLELSYLPGWKGGALLEALGRSRKHDLDNGATSQGPHRADMLMSREDKPVRMLLSRGEQKALAAELLLSQARLLADTGELPLVLLDDLASEFDEQHFSTTLASAMTCAGQVWVTGTRAPVFAQDHKVFHVERGEVREVI
jgi:DNA replication and repair protein RecF